MVSLVSWFLAAICNAVMDTSAHHYWTSKFKNLNQFWWNAEISWKNKYIDKDSTKGRRKLIGKINYPVQLTDAWHFFKMLMIVFLSLSVVSFNYTEHFILFLIIYGIIWNVTFSVFYNHVLK